MRAYIYIAIFVVLIGIPSRAQEANSHTVPLAAIGPEVPYTTELKPPVPVSSLQMPLSFSSEAERSNYVRGGLQLGASYDDNVLTQPTGHIDDVSYLISPSIEIGLTRERWNWNFGYSPGFTLNQRVVERNQAAHSLHMLFDYRLSPHVTAQIHENFEKSNSLFSGMFGSPSAEPGPLQRPNTTSITPIANRTGNTSGLDLIYQFSASSLVGVSGNYYFVNYDAPTASNPIGYVLIDSRSWGGNAFYAHRFANHHWAGVTHNFQRLLFDPGYRTDVNRTLLFYTLPIGSEVTFSVWAGPEYRTTVLPAGVGATSVTSYQNRWDAAGGAELAWQGKRTGARLNYLRQTSDGGGLAQAVSLQQVGGELTERLTKRWTAITSLGYAKDKPLTAVSGLPPYRSWIGSVGLGYELRDNLVLNLSYGRDQLQYEYALSPAVSANRNRAWISISYSFARPLGR